MAKTMRKLNREWDERYIYLAYEHVYEGYSLGSFSGAYSIPSDLWRHWYQTIPQLICLNHSYKQKLKCKNRYTQEQVPKQKGKK